MSRALLVLSLFAIGCGMEPAIKGSGKMATDNRPVGTFTEVECAISCAVDVKKGEKTSVEFSIDDNLLPLIKTEVVGEKLKVYSDKNLGPSDGARIVITTPSLSSFEAAGAVTATIEELSGPKMRIAIAGASEVTGHIAGDALETEIAGSGELKLDGSAPNLSVSIAGSGDVQAQKLTADDVKVEIAGSGKVQVTANKNLNISIAGSGDVIYSGDATVKQSIAGSGNVTKAAAPESSAPPATEGEAK
jgi:hypothetical protein